MRFNQRWLQYGERSPPEIRVWLRQSRRPCINSDCDCVGPRIRFNVASGSTHICAITSWPAAFCSDRARSDDVRPKWTCPLDERFQNSYPASAKRPITTPSPCFHRYGFIECTKPTRPKICTLAISVLLLACSACVVP